LFGWKSRAGERRRQSVAGAALMCAMHSSSLPM
jgi:hypothetical protein